MTVLDVFALIVLLVLVAAALGTWLILGMLPGRIARQRNHPQAEAVSVCGWWGVITMGVLLPLAFIWAYTHPKGLRDTDKDGLDTAVNENPEGVAV